ncbi:ABC transporter ATP-binding protein [Gleimia sp. 6138-11-ORH1]|nr:ABC transporter ATP-binding protein [Gleimia sp. 6138-11-ORH1]MCS4484579.1 ABC transporter ATP-binding protein [Gleimia sp. 6138-11-ORH1]
MLEIKGIKANYGKGPEVLKGIDLQLQTGEVTAVLGASGSGKTTLLRVLAGLHTANAGEAIYSDSETAPIDLLQLPIRSRGIGLVPQEGALFPNLTVAQNIAYGLRGVSKRQAAAHPRVKELLALLEIDTLAQRYPHELSGGQRQRVALARALAPSPRLLLLDEPFSALDAQLRTQVRAEVFQILRKQQIPILLVTHDRSEALSAADQVAILEDGLVAQCGSPREVYFQPVSASIARFIGEGSVIPNRLLCGGLQLLTQVTGDQCFIRPEQVQLRLADTAVPQEQLVVARSIHFYGHSQVVDVVARASGETISVRVPAQQEIILGGEYELVFSEGVDIANL